MNRFKPAEHYESEIKTWEDVIITSILAAIGVNLLVSGVVIKLNQTYSLALIIIGFLLCCATSVLFLIKRLKALETNEAIEGFFVYDRENKDIICVPGYEIEEHMWLHMLSAYSNNQELKDKWKENKIGEIEFRSDGGFRIQRITTESDNIVSELIEYCIIEVLSTHLIDYFSGFAEEELKKLTRDDVPKLLSCNRFLKWLSEPSGDEGAFKEILCSEMPTKEKTEKLLSVVPQKPYARFEIALPKDGSLIKEDDSIVIDHPLFSVELSSLYEGCSATIPAGFENRYLGLDNILGRYGFFNFTITLSAKFKKKALFSKDRRKYSLWIDSLAKRLNDFASSEVFFERIGWYTANTVIECMNHLSFDNTSKR